MNAGWGCLIGVVIGWVISALIGVIQLAFSIITLPIRLILLVFTSLGIIPAAIATLVIGIVAIGIVALTPLGKSLNINVDLEQIQNQLQEGVNSLVSSISPAQTYTITSNQNVNARSCPGLNCSVVTAFAPGESIEVIATVQGDTFARSTEWLKVRYNDSDVYIHSSLAKFQENQNGNTRSIPFQDGDFEYTLMVSYDSQRDFYVIENGADFVVWQIRRMDADLLVADQYSLAEWWRVFVNYVAEVVGKLDRMRRANVEPAICSNETDNQHCIERLRYKVGNHLMDTSGLGNIAFGYFLNYPQVYQYIKDREDKIADILQGLNPKTFPRIAASCFLSRLCIIDTILNETTDNPDDVKQRQVGRNFSVAVKENNEPLREETLIRIADLFNLGQFG